MKKRIACTAALLLFGLNTAATAEDGETIYQEAQPGCGVCHNTGTAGAPRVGAPDTWGERLDASIESLAETVLSGQGAMPGYEGRLSEEQARAVVKWMVEETRD